MEIGKFSIEQLSEGFFELFVDGSFKKLDPSRLKNTVDDPSLGKHSSALGIDPVYITDGETNIVVDPGLGWGLDHKSRYKKTSNILTNLDIFGLRPEDIHYVILTHLHFDHVAGSTFVNDDIKTTATFPNATYIVHKDEWNYALEKIVSSEKSIGADYNLDEFYKLVAENRIFFLEDNRHNLIKGVTLIKTGGHTPGHLVIYIRDKDKSAFYMGDLIPTEYHLNHYAMKQVDADPLQAKKAKKNILRMAFKENSVLLFYHSLYKKAGKLSLDEHKKYVLIDL